MSLDEKLYWHDHDNQICASLVKYFGIFNHIKNFVSLRILKQLYYAFIYSRIQYGIEAYGSCAKETISKLQIMPNKLLKVLLKWDRRTPTDLVHQRLSILKIDDVYFAKVLSFVNECRSCRVPEMFVNYYKIRETELNLRNRSSLDSHGLGLSGVLADVISKVHDYGTVIYRQPVNCYIKRASISNVLNFLLASAIDLRLHSWDYNLILTLKCTQLNFMCMRIMSFIYMFTMWGPAPLLPLTNNHYMVACPMSPMLLWRPPTDATLSMSSYFLYSYSCVL